MRPSNRSFRLAALLGAGALAAACGGDPDRSGSRAGPAAGCADPALLEVVDGFGRALQRVSLLAPDSIVREELRAAYAPFAADSLLQRWAAEPASAPGREGSSPWPERIQAISAQAAGEGACRVEGEIIYQTSVQGMSGGEALRRPVSLTLGWDEAWRVIGLQVGEPLLDPDSEAAVALIRGYYTAIAERDFRRAYELWSGAGAASGQSYEQFVAGFERTESVAAEVGRPGSIEGAAGSRYVSVPVVVGARTREGENQGFEGTYVLRRSAVDGATSEQRAWRIESADLRRIR